MNSLFLFKPDEKIKWICSFEPNKQIFIALFLTEKFYDIRVLNQSNLNDIKSWKEELLSQEWVEVENNVQNDLILDIFTNKILPSRQISLDDSEIKKIYETYKVDND